MTRRYGSLFTESDGFHPDGVSAESRSYRLLLVDDDPNILAALRRVFHRENYDLLLAGSGQQALEILKSQPVEVVISDFKMPGMDGNQLLQIVREQWPHTIRILLTGHANPEVVMGSMKEGAVYRFTLKPWNDEDLRLTVAMALEQHEARQRRHGPLEAVEAGREISLERLHMAQRNRLPSLLHDKQHLTNRQLQRIQKEIQATGNSAIQLLLKHQWAEPRELYRLLKEQTLCEEIDLRDIEPDDSLLELVSLAECERQWILPVRLVQGRLHLAMADPLDTGLVEAIGAASGLEVRRLLCPIAQLKERLSELRCRYGSPEKNVARIEDPFDDLELLLDEQEVAGESLKDLLHHASEPPAVRLVNAFLVEGLNRGAREITLQPKRSCVAVRYRIDGVLRDVLEIPADQLLAVVSRLKIMAELDVSEQQTPQVGRMTVKAPMRIFELRVSTIPTALGEQVTIRVIPTNAEVMPLSRLGMPDAGRQRLIHACMGPLGMVLVVGPADSGRSTLLHALLKYTALPDGSYITIQQPQEFHNEVATQARINRELNCTSVGILDAAAAQGADAILIDDDQEPRLLAKAVQVAMTDAKILTSLRATSLANAFSRLRDCQVGPHELASSLEAVVLVRLVRKLCAHCREESNVAPTVCQALGERFAQHRGRWYRARGCSHCDGGYRGRTGLYEVVLMTDELRQAIASQATPWELQRLAAGGSRGTLLDDAFDKVTQGVTDAGEVLRVLGPQVSV